MSRSTISIFKLFEMFPDDANARTYLESRLWPNGVTCPECKSMERITVRKDGYYRCNACGGIDFTFRTGTIFERGHISPRKLCVVLFLFGDDPEISPKLLAEQVGLTHKTAWLLLRDLREASGDLFLPRLDLDNPHFRAVANFPAYRIGDDGSIWTRWRRGKKNPQMGWAWREMKAIINKQRGNYRNVILYDGRGKEKHERVSRLVCAAFHGPCPVGLECNHRDLNSLNDAAENLFWGTHAENMATARTSVPHPQAQGERNHKAKITDAQLAEIIELRGKIPRRDVAVRFGISRTRVSQIWAGKRLTYERLTA